MRKLAVCAVSAFIGSSCLPDVIDHSEPPFLDCSGVIIEETDPSVTGLEIRTVSEYGGSPVGGIELQIDGGVWILTDADGRASVSAPNGAYDLIVHQVMADNEFRFDDIWSFNDLTANVLTICVDGSRAIDHTVAIAGSILQAEGANPVRLFAPGATSDPQQTYSFSYATPGNFDIESRWEGGVEHEVDFFALEFASSAPLTSFDAASEYFSFGHQTVQVPASPAEPVDVSGVQLTMESVEQGTISGAIDGSELHELSAHLSLEVRGYQLQLGVAAIDLSRNFSVVYPEVDGARLVLDVASFDTATGAVGRHTRRVDRSASFQSFDIPAPIEVISPVDGSTITPASTTFTWQPNPSNGRAGLRFACNWGEIGAPRNVNYRLIESSTGQVTLPVVPGVTIDPGARCEWRVASYERVSWDEHRYAVGRTISGTTQ